MDTQEIDALVIGAGAVGLSVAWELAKAGREVAVIEREPHVGSIQSARNSGVIHAGIYYESGSAKARLCVRGAALMREFCKTYGVPHQQTGKLVVATSLDDLEILGMLERQAAQNGVEGCLILGGAGVRHREPNVRALAALYVPGSGIIDAASYVAALKRLCQNLGVNILTKTSVNQIFLDNGLIVSAAEAGGREVYIHPRLLVNAAGLDAVRIAKMINPANPWQYALTRGEYVTFNARQRACLELNGRLVYPVPRTYQGLDGEKYTSLGIHLTQTFQMNARGEYIIGPIVLVGPSAKPVPDTRSYENNRYPQEYFVEAVHEFFPALHPEDCELSYSGIVARLAAPHRDFIITRDQLFPNCIHLVGIDSPGLTASLAIALEVKNLVNHNP